MKRFITICGGTALTFGLMACGNTDREADRADRDVNIRTYDETVDEGAPSTLEEERNDIGEPSPEGYGYELDDLTVVSSAMVGELGPLAFDDDSARGSGASYSESESGYTYLDLRTTTSDGRTAMVGINIDGPLDHPDLRDGKVFTWTDWGDGEVHVDAIGCAGTEDMWEDYDAPADEVEITVTPDGDDPDTVLIEFVGSWTSYDGLETMDVKGAAKLDSGS